MSRAGRGLKDVIKQSASTALGFEEPYNFIKGKKDVQSGMDGMTREQLLNRIESLEYDLTIMTENLASTQRNFETVSRLLKAEKEKDRDSLNQEKGRLADVESALRVSEARVKDLLAKIENAEKQKQNTIQELESKTVKFQVEANHSQSTMNELRSRLSQKTAECDQLIIKIKDIEKRSSETSATTKDEAKKLAELEKRHQQLISDLHAAKAESSQKDSQLNDLKTRLEAQFRESKTAIDSYKREIDKYIQDNGTLRAAEATAQRQLRHLKDTHQAQTGQYSQRENTVKELDRENKELRVRIKEIEEKLEEKIRAIEGLGRLAEAGRKVESVREVHGECVVLAKKEVDGLKEKEQKLMVEVKSMKETIAKKDVRIVELSSNVETLKTELEKKGQLEVQIKDLQSKLDVARSEAQNLAKNTKSGQTEISVLQGKVAQLQKDLVAQLEQTDANKAEVNVWKRKVDSLQKELQNKVTATENHKQATEGLGAEIHSLKEQLFQKIQTVNSLNSKNSTMSDVESQLRSELKQKQELMTKLKEVESQKDQASKKLAELENQLAKLFSELHQSKQESKSALEERDRIIREDKAKTLSIAELTSKLKGANLRLEDADQMMKKYDLANLDSKLDQLKSKSTTLGKNAKKMKAVMDSLKCLVTCTKCTNVPKEGKSLFPCGHTICSGCDSTTLTTCPDCKVKIDYRARNTLIDEILHRANYMSDTLDHTVESCIALEQINMGKV